MVSTEVDAPELKSTTARPTEYNAVAPIFTIPTEILQLFFCFYSYSATPTELILLTHVCRVWRSAALECSEIWTNISPSHPLLLESFLVHSKNRLLSVVHDADRSSIMSGSRSDFLTQITQHSKRIKSLYVRMERDEVGDFISQIWTELPSLFAITLLSSANSVRYEDEMPITKVTAIPLPSLRVIRIINIPVALPWEHFQNIVNFTIINIPDACITMQDIVSVVSASPRLETLYLGCLFEGGSGPSSMPPLPSVSFPTLSSLSLKLIPTWAISYLLLMMPRNPSTSIDIKILYIGEGPAGMQVLSYIQNYISASWLFTQANLYLRLSGSGPRISLPTGSPSIFVSTGSNELHRAISILQTSNLASIKYLRIDWVMDSEGQYVWDELMSSLSGLEQLSVSFSWDKPKLLKALTCHASPPTGTHTDAPLQTVPCPSLIALEIEVPTSSLRCTDMFDALLECIHSRLSFSHPVKRLRLVPPSWISPFSFSHSAIGLYGKLLNKVVAVEVCGEFSLSREHVVRSN